MPAAKVLPLALLAIASWTPLATTQNLNGCTFDTTGSEVSTCNLIMDATIFRRKSWKTGTGATSASQGGPEVDAQQSSTGGYGFTTTSDMLKPRQQPYGAWMITSPTNSSAALCQCLKFAYSLGGLGVQSLEILLLTYKNDDIDEALTNDSVPIEYHSRSLWRTKQSTQTEWQKAQVTFCTPLPHSLVFSACPDTPYANYHGYVAVDDISFEDGPCQNDCMFDRDLCSWANNDTVDNFDWRIGHSSNKRGTGPSSDQVSSLNSYITTGGYAYVDSSYPRLPGDKAWLMSGVIEPTQTPLCIRFWVNIHGGGVGNFRLLYSPSDGASEPEELWGLWRGTTWGTDTWYPCQQTVAANEDFRLVFEGSVGVPGAGDIGLDSITFTTGTCPSLPPGSSRSWGDCTFLDNTCNWTLPGSSISSSGCKFLSHVAGSNYYPAGHTESVYNITDMYMKFDLNCYKTKARDRAALMSPYVTIKSDVCLSFWSYMYTNVASQTHVGALKVVLMYEDKNTTIWRLQNQQHARWTYAQVTIPASDSSVKVAIEGVQGPKVMGMIGVDDITVFPSSCPLKPASASVQVADCTFDHDLCEWQLETTGQDSSSYLHRWHLAASDKLLRDHTFDADGGSFAYLDSFNTNHKSRIKSPLLPASTTFCLSFAFSEIYQDTAAKLSLIRSSEGSEDVLWNVIQQAIVDPPVSINNVASWRYAQVLLEPLNTTYQLILEGEVVRSAWAVDDFHFMMNRSDCSLKPSYASP